MTLRARTRYLALMVGTIVVGLFVHERGTALSPAVRDFLGDALWAAMVVWAFGVVAPRLQLRWRAAGALAVSFAVEFSQLVHFPAIDALRKTALGALALGSGFDPRDFAAYTAGVFGSVLIEWTTRRRS